MQPAEYIYHLNKAAARQDAEDERAVKKAAKQAERAGKHAVTAAEVSVPVQSVVGSIAEKISAHAANNADAGAEFIASQLRGTEDELAIGQPARGFRKLNDVTTAYALSSHFSEALGTVPVWGKHGGLTPEAAAFPIIDLAKLYEIGYNDEITATDKYVQLNGAGRGTIMLHADGVTQEVIQSIPGMPGGMQVNVMSAVGVGSEHLMKPDEIGIVVAPT
ncbi:MAG TPA: hypothetical protein VLG13_02455 [Patescibacteria group bacterium]|nr:hypothetical protein [Patescibacteria group bacterium]